MKIESEAETFHCPNSVVGYCEQLSQSINSSAASPKSSAYSGNAQCREPRVCIAWPTAHKCSWTAAADKATITGLLCDTSSMTSSQLLAEGFIGIWNCVKRSQISEKTSFH